MLLIVKRSPNSKWVITYELFGWEVFSQAYTGKWSEEVFTVNAVHYIEPITYKIKDLDGEEIKGSFYTEELQKTHQDTFCIERVLETKGNKMLVKWKGYPETLNSWVSKKDILQLNE